MNLIFISSCSPSEGEFESVDEELAGIEDDVESDFEDVSDEKLDVDELELEAEKAVREYSLSLSKELKIGACFYRLFISP